MRRQTLYEAHPIARLGPLDPQRQRHPVRPPAIKVALMECPINPAGKSEVPQLLCASDWLPTQYCGIRNEETKKWETRRYPGQLPTGQHTRSRIPGPSHAGISPTCYASIRTFFSRSHWRVLAALMKPLVSLASTVPASLPIPPALSTACAPLSAAMALRWP